MENLSLTQLPAQAAASERISQIITLDYEDSKLGGNRNYQTERAATLSKDVLVADADTVKITQADLGNAQDKIATYETRRKTLAIVRATLEASSKSKK